MRIEVLVGNEDPVIFPLNSTKVTVGSSESCDIFLEADGVSRKHLVVISEDENYYVVDQGSTNGSFINEERLIPGRKVEFTSFFPVRLGDNVLISLLSDEDGLDHEERPLTIKEKSVPNIVFRNEEDSTKVIPLQKMKQVKTENLVLERNVKRKAIKKKKESKPKKKQERNYVPYLSLLILVGAAYYNIVYMKPEVQEVKVAQVGQIVKVKQKPLEKKAVSRLIAEENFVPKEKFESLINDIKCTTDVEKYLCEFFPDTNIGQLGAVHVGLSLNVLIDGTKYFEEADKLVKPPIDDSPVTLKERADLVDDTAIYLYLLRARHDVDMSLLKDFDLYLAFFNNGQDGMKVQRVLSIKPEVFKDLKKAVGEANLHFIRTNGASALLVTRDYYRTY